MTRTYATDEQYERWYMAECCRCEPPQAQGRQLAGRIRLPDLLGPRRPNTGDLPGMRPGACPSRASPR
ncbi:hypothetical protein J2X68_001176 [Streptomyces sp. 3330]|nr:hypothetical protein [Streptomyces sp. 3330]